MSVDKTKGEIGIYGILKNDTDSGILAYADQIKDTSKNKLQSDINNDINLKIENIEQFGNTVSETITRTVDRVSNLETNKVDKVENKQLSEEDFTTVLKNKLENLSNYNDTEIKDKINTLQNRFNTLLDNNPDKAINSFNEIISFLNGINDKDTLDGILADIAEQLDNKANISNLSNILGEEVIDKPLLEEINIITREEIKKDLFIDMWNAAAGKYGTYNTDTGYFELNGLTDITYDEALNIYSYLPLCNVMDTERNHRFANIRNVRTLFPVKCLSGFGQNNNYAFLNCQELQKIVFVKHTASAWGVANCEGMFNSCTNLVTVEGEFRMNAPSYTNTDMFVYCFSLKDIRITNLDRNVDFKYSKNLSYETLIFLVTNASTTAARTVTVHADVYAKLTNDATNQAAAALTPEEAAQWQQLVTDAAAKQITFATV